MGSLRVSLVAVVASATMLTACATTGVIGQGPATDVAFTPCDKIACAGTLNGAHYEIVMPAQWNGTLLLYSHGYRPSQPVPPGFDPVDTTAEPAPGWASGSKAIGNALLQRGFALAGSSYAANGWAVPEGIAAGEDLFAYFRENLAVPQRVYAWGDSLGGLITAELAERHPDWVSGSAPVCGVLAGAIPSFDLSLDVEYAVRELLWPQFRITGFTSYEDALTNLETAAKRVLAAAADTRNGGAAKVLYIAAVGGAPLATQRFDGSTQTSRLNAAAEGVITALGMGTYGRYDIEQRVDGNPSTNIDTDYSNRADARERQAIDALAPGATAKYSAALAAGQRTSADVNARSSATALGDPQGTASTPMITLHTISDPLVISANESWYQARSDQADSGASQLVQLITVPPATYPQQPGAPYGAGHCNLTPASRLGLITLLDDWIRNAAEPDPSSAALVAALGPASGFDPAAVAPPWPADR